MLMVMGLLLWRRLQAQQQTLLSKVTTARGCPVYVLDEILQVNIAGLPKWEPRSREGIYLGQSPLHTGSLSLVLNPETCHVSLQFHLVFDYEFSTVSFMREDTIPPN